MASDKKTKRDEPAPPALPSKDNLEAEGSKAIPTPAPAAIEATLPAPDPAPAPAPKATRYRVWAHGTLQRNGKTYKPGDELTLHPDDAASIPCLEKA